MDELIRFLEARLDEDEATARRVRNQEWRVYERFHMPWLDGPDLESRFGGVIGVPDMNHIARHDPARVLREVAADRKLIEAWYTPFEARPGQLHPSIWKFGYVDGLIFAIQCRAERFSDHPDYRAEWRV